MHFRRTLGTRPFSGPEVYEDAKRRLRAAVTGQKPPATRRAGEALLLGEEAAYVANGVLRVGTTEFDADQVREYAIRGANLPLPGGRLLQAGLGLLLFAAHERAERGDDPEELASRIRRYEQWTGHGAGR